MTDYGLLYAATRERVTTMVRELDDAALRTPVRACPGWTVHDVVAHFAGAVTDALAGRLEGVGGDAWTAAQVEARRDVPVADMLDEWAGASPQFEDALRAIGPPLAGTAVSDAFQHEQDIRGTLDLQGGRDLDLMLASIESYATGLGPRLQQRGLAPLRLEAGAHEFMAGDGEPGATVIAEPFELTRALGGRRTVEEVRRLHWDGDAEPYVPLVSAYGVPATSLGEH
jgi:uncharacterized protein (TIGR03083 family)